MANLITTKPQTISVLQKALVTGKNFIIKQSPIILAGAAVGGVVTTGILAVQAGIRANEILKEKEEENGESLTTKEKIEESWRTFIPPVISGVLTVGAIVASTTISQKRQTALAGLYALSEAALKEYQDKVEEKYGTKEAQKIKDEINSTALAKMGPPPWDESVLPTGEVLCFDKLTARYFHSSVQKIKTAEAQLNSLIYSGEMCADLNELYSLIDDRQLPPCKLGEEVGWNISTPCQIYFTSALTSDMRPCLVIDFVHGNEPTYRYRDI